ncbi:MAG: hypothetical protein H0T09_07495 [Actinobacteria bacterium]|nr:hypothetical protein [Actinomycetota bacterium]
MHESERNRLVKKLRLLILGQSDMAQELVATLAALPAEAWQTIRLERRGRYNRPQVHEQEVSVRGCPLPLRQLAVRGLGHEQPTRC